MRGNISSLQTALEHFCDVLEIVIAEADVYDVLLKLASLVHAL